MNDEIKNILDEIEDYSKHEYLPPCCELTNEDCKHLLDYITNLQSKIDKAIEYIEKDILNEKIEKVNWDYDECYYSDMPAERIKPLIDILKVKNNEWL